eukprot:TRINITY_DN7300_c0_g1_i1.p1 TRINITY_DN7300_c0_g1~~TRINITY_DN7300_c0_g1_i1.p1  ORF type:complete len:229 (+),score=82.58 TRINITY_DN7300_c0_g1_i1:74-760(+)
MAGADGALCERIRELLTADPSAGYRGLHAKLKEEPDFKDIGLKKVQTALQQVKEAAAAAAVPKKAGPGENLWTAASDGDIARVMELMECEGFTPTSPDENGYTPTQAAAAWGHAELLKLLLQRDSSAANVADSDGDTPLHHVADSNELEDEQLRPVVELLLEARADPSIKNLEGKNCMDVCGACLLEERETEEEPVINMRFLTLMAEKGFLKELPELPKDMEDDGMDS